ncbi:hypothetical protein ACE41H_15435 [Paenibacillus enshidis]|uniref:Tubulin/FtsZ GTPase domain-containing protein n=1 Tax=Paenibacillus enshidis TaxID=1458439 RepID=A0ABV5AVC7_9BACL
MDYKLGFITLEGFVRGVANKESLKLCFIACGQFGGKQGDELARLNHSVHAINTAETDLADLKVIKNIIKLDNYNGAVKDIERGQMAIRDNREKVLSVLQHPDVTEADFVFVAAGMGGGTGNAAAPMLLANLAKIRKPFNGKPSYGGLISVPGSWEQRGIKKNARWGLSHIDDLIRENACGSVMIIDNEKLYNLTESIFSDNGPLSWEDYGNSTIAALITEVLALTALPSGKTFDADELLDVLCTPGYFSFGKTIIKDGDSRESNSLSSYIDRAFKSSPTASDYDYELDAINGFVAVVHPKSSRNPIITDSDFRTIEENFGEYIANAEKPHSGMIANEDWGLITGNGKVKGEDPKALLYVGAVTDQLPARITQMLEEIEQEEKTLSEKKSKRASQAPLDLSAFKKLDKREFAASSEVGNEFDLFAPSKSKDDEDDDNFLL